MKIAHYFIEKLNCSVPLLYVKVIKTESKREVNLSMLKIGTGELIVILAVALLIFGPSRLPALGKMVGKAVGTLRHYANTENWAELEEEEKGAAPAHSEEQPVQAQAQTTGDQEAV